ncbi:MAG: FG-GAP repeat protein [Dokdonella sp.]
MASDTQCYRATLRGTTLVVGCWNPAGSREGAVYVFERSASLWSQARKITLSAPSASDQFGSDVAIGGDGSLYVGAYRRDIDFIDQGAIYVYQDDVLFKNGFE